MFFDGDFFSIHSHLVKKLMLSELCRKKSYRALKIHKMACSKLVKLKIKNKLISFFF